MKGLREDGLRALKDQGMLVEPVEIVLNEKVFPWVYAKMMDYMVDEDYVDINVEDVVRDAFEAGKTFHKASI